jgi:hypothetical protein
VEKAVNDRLDPYAMARQRLSEAMVRKLDEEIMKGVCPECHGTGFADEGRPCEHPGREQKP